MHDSEPTQGVRKGTLVAFALLVAVLAVKLRFLLGGAAITGWDTPGHLQMAGTYAGLLFGSFDSLGNDPFWFGGYPAFYFYPPLLYLLMALPQLLGLSVEAAFGLGVFGAIALVGWAYLRWVDLLLEDGSALQRGALALAAAAFYLAYPGDGHQGVALSGALGGTVAATFGHGIAVLALHRLELCRRDPAGHHRVAFVLLAGLLFYAHLLTCVFFFGLVGLYLAVCWRDFGCLRDVLTTTLAPILVGAPIIGLYLGYAHFSDMIQVQEDVPGLLAVVGVDAWIRVKEGGSLITELIRWFKWVPLVMLGLFAAGVLRMLTAGDRRAPRIFLVVAAGLTFLVTQDASASWVLSGPGIHWYRAYSLFFGLLAVFAVLTLQDLLRWVPSSWRDAICVTLAAGALGLLAVYDFAGAAGVRSFVLEETEPADQTRELMALLDGLPPGSLILPEKAADTALYGSPHALDVFIQRAGHRNALGLPVQCSLTARLHYAYFEQGMAQLFQYGIDETWSRVLFAGTEGDPRLEAVLADYLRRAGVQFVLARTRAMREWLEARPAEFSAAGVAGRISLYAVAGAAPLAEWRSGLPLGFVSYGTLAGTPPDPKRQVSRFLVESNQVRLRLGDPPPIVNLDPVWSDVRDRLDAVVSGLVVFHSDEPPVTPSVEAAQGVPLFVVNRGGIAPAGVVRLSTRSAMDAHPFPPQARGAAPVTGGGGRWTVDAPASAGCTPVIVRQSFFPDWSANASLLQTDGNHLYACAPGGHLTLEHRNPLSKVITLAMLLALGGLGVLGIQEARCSDPSSWG